MLNEFKELFQAFILSQFEGLRGDMRALEATIGALDAKIGALDTKIGALDSKIGSVDTKVESFRRELRSEIHRVEKVLSTDFVRLEHKIDLRFAAMGK